MVTADSAGRIKMWDVSNVVWREENKDNKENLIINWDLSANMRVKWFIVAHKALINSIKLVETYADKDDYPLSDSFVLTCGNDCNILLHRLSNGQRVGQFGQSTWNIQDMTTIVGVKVNYVREWIQERLGLWFNSAMERVVIAKSKGLIDEIFEVDTKKGKNSEPSALNDKEKMKAIGFEVDEFE